MTNLFDYPGLVFALSFLALWLATRFGASFLRKKRGLEKDIRDDFSTILVSTLTLNGLIIGFSFSMATSRYEVRKSYEEAEANAIGTEYARADLLPAAAAAKVRALLSSYLDQRIAFYEARSEKPLREINARTARLQTELWSTVADAGVAQPTPTVALAAAGMNDVLNSQGYTQAAWLNRIPQSAWCLMIAIAVIGNLLIGYGAEKAEAESLLFMVLPCVLSIAFLLIAEIESPRAGIIRVDPQNLISLAESLRSSGSPTGGPGSAAR
ncbi:MAG: hypothetical protein ACLP2F_17330 [Steroidobacteraceae bacterium]